MFTPSVAVSFNKRDDIQDQWRQLPLINIAEDILIDEDPDKFWTYLKHLESGQFSELASFCLSVMSLPIPMRNLCTIFGYLKSGNTDCRANSLSGVLDVAPRFVCVLYAVRSCLVQTAVSYILNFLVRGGKLLVIREIPQQLRMTPLERQIQRQLLNEIDRQRQFGFDAEQQQQVRIIPTPGITRPVEVTVMVPTNNILGDPIIRYRYLATQSPPTQPPA
ncbi:hypothetical protein QTP88_017010 [Uroleucon formosanum]